MKINAPFSAGNREEFKVDADMHDPPTDPPAPGRPVRFGEYF